MKKSVPWITLSILVIFSLSSWITYTRYKPVPPELEVVAAKHALEVQPVTYSLRKWGRTASADINTEPAVLVRESTPLIVDPNDNIELLFNHSPDSVKCYLWEMDTGKLAYKELTAYPLNLEASNIASGDYALEVRAKWENGYVLYNARIIVNGDEH
ncbi:MULTISPECIES: hypothetical protein [unclassified Bacillus (in: firmicutes)]|uniref:hypothetical protein n=1 Tax=unclassified Bacillus (in: firmicutes) TaxID=185979 RepID=UPI001BE594EC|nr:MULTISPECIES: hypothetical protein [unclassified Bacillus (in: firmicutes)]MBT2637962.1 hypothetical protein [Bacillus sp. ISL-39]MBT2661138.1 hypothetical protein [Bacillus sp. ISL-45]